jgi:mitogen-activated protein kinase kinase kinase
MADERTRRKPKYFVANRGSESEGDSDEESARYNPQLFSPPYPPKAQYSAHNTNHPPSLTTDFSSPYSQDTNSHPSLSSPSSASSQAADESTPPPGTPGSTLTLSSSPSVPIKPSHQSQESIVYSDRYANDYNMATSSRAGKIMNQIKSFTRSHPRTPVDASSRRPRTVSFVPILFAARCSGIV